eukprot:3971198-Pyramimonas_sp.AAC.1
MTTIANMRPPNAGHTIIKWVYREGNERADELTWGARRGNTGPQYKHDIIQEIRNHNIKINAVRGAFDGGRSEMGVGCGWLIDVHAYFISPSLTSSPELIGFDRAPIWTNNIMADAFLLPHSCA